MPEEGISFSAPSSFEDEPVTIAVPGTDPDGDLDTLSIVIETPPKHGTLTIDGLTVTYTPDPDYFGPDSFVYRVSDGREVSERTGTVAFNIVPVEDAPRLEVAEEESAALGFQMAHPVEVYDPDDGETLLVEVDWGDGTSTDEGPFRGR